MKVPAIGAPRPVAAANELILNRDIDVVDVTNVWLLKFPG